LRSSVTTRIFDLTREQVFTPSHQAEEVVDGLAQDVKLTYFHQPRIPAGKRARDMVEVLAAKPAAPRTDRRSRQAADRGRDVRVRIYNAAVLEATAARSRMSTTENQIGASAIQRVLRTGP